MRQRCILSVFYIVSSGLGFFLCSLYNFCSVFCFLATVSVVMFCCCEISLKLSSEVSVQFQFEHVSWFILRVSPDVLAPLSAQSCPHLCLINLSVSTYSPVSSSFLPRLSAAFSLHLCSYVHIFPNVFQP